MSKKIGLLLTSRNNYRFVEKYWIPNTFKNRDIDSYDILNIDEDSSSEQQELGQRVCKDNGIEYLKCNEPGMHNNLTQASDYFESKGVEFIVWSHADAWPMHYNFYNSLNILVGSGGLDKFGTIGFNGIAKNIYGDKLYDKMEAKILAGEKPVCIIGRCHLGCCDHWISGTKSKKTPNPVKGKDWIKPHATCQNTWWVSALNIKLFREHIDTSHKFYFHKSWDDICLQFMRKKIYNLILPTYYITHRQDLKEDVDIPRSSVRLAYKKIDTYSRLEGFAEGEWDRVWGWNFTKSNFSRVKDRYKGTHIYKFHKYDFKKGPWRTFDIENSDYMENS